MSHGRSFLKHALSGVDSFAAVVTPFMPFLPRIATGVAIAAGLVAVVLVTSVIQRLNIEKNVATIAAVNSEREVEQLKERFASNLSIYRIEQAGLIKSQQALLEETRAQLEQLRERDSTAQDFKNQLHELSKGLDKCEESVRLSAKAVDAQRRVWWESLFRPALLGRASHHKPKRLISTTEDLNLLREHLPDYGSFDLVQHPAQWEDMYAEAIAFDLLGEQGNSCDLLAILSRDAPAPINAVAEAEHQRCPDPFPSNRIAVQRLGELRSQMYRDLGSLPTSGELDRREFLEKALQLVESEIKRLGST